ncbi:cupin domain-containing protein [Aquimarina hainanensis]|uniref:Cupin domain-containing protein n=2 Tax=Aquimarina hainanensis TaxID=1578017 RepID=A0ABW5N7S9_9FLAO
MEVINIQKKLSKFDKQWHPHRITIVDDHQVYLSKISGDFIWHTHEDSDELFHVVKGTLYMKFRERTVQVNAGEMLLVPKGTEHCPSTKNGEEVHLLVFEKLNTKHTGNTTTKKTISDYPTI